MNLFIKISTALILSASLISCTGNESKKKEKPKLTQEEISKQLKLEVDKEHSSIMSAAAEVEQLRDDKSKLQASNKKLRKDMINEPDRRNNDDYEMLIKKNDNKIEVLDEKIFAKNKEGRVLRHKKDIAEAKHKLSMLSSDQRNYKSAKAQLEKDIERSKISITAIEDRERLEKDILELRKKSLEIDADGKKTTAAKEAQKTLELKESVLKETIYNEKRNFLTAKEQATKIKDDSLNSLKATAESIRQWDAEQSAKLVKLKDDFIKSIKDGTTNKYKELHDNWTGVNDPKIAGLDQLKELTIDDPNALEKVQAKEDELNKMITELKAENESNQKIKDKAMESLLLSTKSRNDVQNSSEETNNLKANQLKALTAQIDGFAAVVNTADSIIRENMATIDLTNLSFERMAEVRNFFVTQRNALRFRIEQNNNLVQGSNEVSAEDKKKYEDLSQKIDTYLAKYKESIKEGKSHEHYSSKLKELIK